MSTSLVITGRPGGYRLVERVYNTYDGPDYAIVARLTDDEAGALSKSRLFWHLYGAEIEAGGRAPGEFLSITLGAGHPAIILALPGGEAGRSKSLNVEVPGFESILSRNSQEELIRISINSSIPICRSAREDQSPLP